MRDAPKQRQSYNVASTGISILVPLLGVFGKNFLLAWISRMTLEECAPRLAFISQKTCSVVANWNSQYGERFIVSVSDTQTVAQQAMCSANSITCSTDLHTGGLQTLKYSECSECWGFVWTAHNLRTSSAWTDTHTSHQVAAQPKWMTHSKWTMPTGLLAHNDRNDCSIFELKCSWSPLLAGQFR